MEIHQLRYFVAVAEVGSFGGAARRCHVSQPSLSQQIRKLELELGHRLFDRLGRRIAITEIGRALLPKASRILADLRSIEDHLDEEIEAGRGLLTVGAIPTMAPYLLPPAVRLFSERFPHAELELREDFTEGLIERLLHGEIDLAFMSTPVEHESIELEVLGTEPLWLAISREGPLRDRRSVSLRDLEKLPTILLEDMHCLGRQVDDYYRTMRIQRRVVCRTSQLTTILELVRSGLGVALVPRMSASAASDDPLQFLPIRSQPPQREIAAARLAGRSRSFLADRFLECLRTTSLAATHDDPA
jgi:LysR family hydrogen peroxide-inducible transcriptional activator